MITPKKVHQRNLGFLEDKKRKVASLGRENSFSPSAGPEGRERELLLHRFSGSVRLSEQPRYVKGHTFLVRILKGKPIRRKIKP